MAYHGIDEREIAIDDHIVSAALGVSYTKEKKLDFAMLITLEDDKAVLPFYLIDASMDPIEMREILDNCYTLYLSFMGRFFGEEVFHDFSKLTSYADFIAKVSAEMKKHEEYKGCNICTEEHLYNVQRCIRQAEGTEYEVMEKGCEVCPNKKCKIHP